MASLTFHCNPNSMSYQKLSPPQFSMKTQKRLRTDIKRTSNGNQSLDRICEIFIYTLLLRHEHSTYI